MLLSGAGAQDRAITARTSINWKTETVLSVVSLDAVKSGIVLPTGRNAAIQMLEMETPALLKDPFFSVLVDSSERIGDSMELESLSLSDLNRIIDAGKTTPPAFSPDLKNLSMTHAVSLSELGSLYIRHRSAYESAKPLKTVPTMPYSGILVDARGALPLHGEYASDRLEPCLFPKIWSEDMDLAYEKNMVEPAIARAHGIVSYSSSTDENDYREIIGTTPLRIVARGIFGQNRTDPLIPVNDYLKIVSLPQNRKLLAQGKVVILCDADRLEGTSLGPVRDDAYYFARGEIRARLERKPVKNVDLSDTWEGLTMTIYDIRFEADTSRILADEKGRLDVIAEALKAAGPDARFMVEGHTANVGKPGGELRLSVERARVIASELAKRGIAADNIGFTGYGGARPIAANDTDEGRAKNRRVEITIKQGTSASR